MTINADFIDRSTNEGPILLANVVLGLS